MAKPFDAAAKRLVEANPIAWLHFAGLPGAEAEPIDADLTTVTSEADRILHVQTPEYLAHIELQSTYEEDMDARILRYNVLAYCKYRLPVVSVLFLLREEADGPAMSGRLDYEASGYSEASLQFRFKVMRVWETDPAEILNGSLAILPLAPLANVSAQELPSLVKRMEERIDAEAEPEEKGILWTTTFLLPGLKYEREFAVRLLKGVRAMKESSTYQYILDEGRVEEARRMLFILGGKRFGNPDTKTQAALNAITSSQQLEQLAARLLEVESWQELLS
jgi:predicted transposase YdaD